MNLADRSRRIREVFENELWPLIGAKGRDYTIGLQDSEDALGNFKEVGARLGLTKYQVWATYCAKHFDSILAWVKTGKLESESLRGRFLDLINYALLGLLLVEEDAWMDGGMDSSDQYDPAGLGLTDRD